MPEITISPLLEPNRLPQKGRAIPKFDVRSIWKAVGFDPHAGQEDIFKGWQVHDVTTAVCGTRFGKSELAAHLPLGYIAPCWQEVIRDGRRVRVDHHTRGAVIAPTFDLTKIIMEKVHSRVLQLCDLLGYPKGRKRRDRYVDLDEGETDNVLDEPGTLTVRRIAGNIREIVTPWGNIISAYTMENPAGLLGKAFDWIITDESGQFSEGDWSNYFEYADRARLDHQGWVYHGTTPKGFNSLYDKFFLPGQPGPQRDEDYISFQMPTHRNPHMDRQYLEKLRKRTPPRLWAMNYEAKFTVLEGQVYEEFSREVHVRDFACSPDWLYFTGVDFGFTDPFVCLLMAWTGESLVVIDEVYEPNLTLVEQKVRIDAMLRARVPPGARWLDNRDSRWTAWCDPRNPQARADWAGVGLPMRKSPTRIKGQRNEIEAGAHIVAGFIHPVEDEPVPAFLRRPGEVLGAAHLYVHERCEETIHSLLSWVKMGSGYDGPDHAVDALRYGIMGARRHLPTLAEMQGMAGRRPAQAPPGPKTLKTRPLRTKSGGFDIGVR